MLNGKKPAADLYRWVVESSTDAYWMTDREGRMLFATPRLAELLDRPFEYVRTMSAYEMFDEAGREDFAAHLAELETRHEAWDHAEVLLIRRDGSSLWTSCSIFPVIDDDGAQIGWMHRLTEFTALRDLNEKLRESERQLSRAQQVARLGSWEWDLRARTAVWSVELTRLLRLEDDQRPTTAESFEALVHPADLPIVRRASADLEAGATVIDFTARMRTGDGEFSWIRQIGVLESDADGVPLRMTGTAQDVTDFKLAEEATTRATGRLRLLQRLAATSNSAHSLAEALDVGAGQLAEETGWQLIDARLVGSGEPFDGSETARRAVREQATVRSGRRVAIPVKYAGRVVCVVELDAGRDRTDGGYGSDGADDGGFGRDRDPLLLATMEQALGQLSRVAEREQQAAALAAARDEAVEADRLKSEFLSTMSHEIRTPMNGVIGLTDLLQQTVLDDHQRQLADGLYRTGRSLLDLINDILDLSKIEAGGLELEATDVDLRELLDQTETVLGASARAKGLQLSTLVDATVPERFRGDPGRIAQVVLNLGSNAVRFTDHGQVTIRATGSAEDQKALRIEVTDTGIGIADDHRERLFEAFVQADPSTTRRHGGTGLGLAICRRLVTAMGGELGLSSTLGQGSTFWFTVPIGDRETAVASGRPGSEPHPVPIADGRSRPRRGQTVLVAEDNPVNQLVARGLLETLGFDVELVGDGREAVEAVAASAAASDAALVAGPAYAAVLMDCRMPVLDGYDASRQIRAAEPPGRHLPIIAVTASVLADERRRCLSAGMDDFVAKPVDLDCLDAALNRWVPNRRPEEESSLGSRVCPEPESAIELDGPAETGGPAEKAGPAEAGGSAEQRIDYERQAVLASMVSKGSSLLDRVVAGFVEAAPGLLAGIERAVADRDGAAVEAAAHKLKGGAGNLGLPRLAAMAAELEEVGEQFSGTVPEAGWPAERLLDAIRCEQDAVLAELLSATRRSS